MTEAEKQVVEAAKAFCGLNEKGIICNCMDGYCSVCRLHDAVEGLEERKPAPK